MVHLIIPGIATLLIILWLILWLIFLINVVKNSSKKIKDIPNIIELKYIIIHWDFVDGSELSYKEGLEKGSNFNTCCLDFFSFDTKVDNVFVIRKDGKIIDRNELLLNDGKYTAKEIRPEHNIHKLLITGSLNFV